jgi:hypothetical protein
VLEKELIYAAAESEAAKLGKAKADQQIEKLAQEVNALVSRGLLDKCSCGTPIIRLKTVDMAIVWGVEANCGMSLSSSFRRGITIPSNASSTCRWVSLPIPSRRHNSDTVRGSKNQTLCAETQGGAAAASARQPRAGGGARGGEEDAQEVGGDHDHGAQAHHRRRQEPTPAAGHQPQVWKDIPGLESDRRMTSGQSSIKNFGSGRGSSS